MTLQEIVEFIGLNNQDEIEITGLNTLLDSNENQLTFLENKKYINDLKNTKAAAVLVTKENVSEVPSGTIALVCDEPYLNLAKISKLFAPNVIEMDGEKPIVGGGTKVIPNVYIGKDSVIGSDCTIMAGAFIGDNVKIGNNTIIYPNVTIYRDCTVGNDCIIHAGTVIGSDCTIMAGAFIGDNVKIGNNTIIYPNVTVYRDCTIGNDCIIHAGTVIGSDGFGFANTKDGKYIKIYQNGNVTIGNDVEIGANCAIDRAVFNSTIIEDGVRIDNLVHIAHNCKIG